MEVSLSDVTTLASFAMQIDPDPARLAGRMLGLSALEQQAAPRWGWIALGVGVAAAAALTARGHFLRRDRDH